MMMTIIDHTRLWLAYIMLFSLPLVIIFWVVVHSTHHLWKGQSRLIVYGVAGLAMIIGALALYSSRALFLAQKWPFSWLWFLLGLAIYLSSYRLWKPVKQHLDFKTFSGQREVGGEASSLITSGPFSVIRHPRYLMVTIGVVGWCLMAHYPMIYGVGLASIAGLYAVIMLEERDLIARYGPAYRDYKTRVPRLFPNFEGLKKIAQARYNER